MDLTLNNLERLIYHKNQQTNLSELGNQFDLLNQLSDINPNFWWALQVLGETLLLTVLLIAFDHFFLLKPFFFEFLTNPVPIFQSIIRKKKKTLKNTQTYLLFLLLWQPIFSCQLGQQSSPIAYWQSNLSSLLFLFPLLLSFFTLFICLSRYLDKLPPHRLVSFFSNY